jgi:hypothetical protein
MLEAAFNTLDGDYLANMCSKPYYDDGFTALTAAANLDFVKVPSAAVS